MDVLSVLGIRRTPNQDVALQIKKQKEAAQQAKNKAINAVGQLLRPEAKLYNVPQVLDILKGLGSNAVSAAMNVPVLRENIAVQMAKQQARNNLNQEVAKMVTSRGIDPRFGWGGGYGVDPSTNRLVKIPLNKEEEAYIGQKNIEMISGIGSPIQSLGGASDDLAKVMATNRANNILDDIANLTKNKSQMGLSALHLPSQNVYAQLPANVLNYLKNEVANIPVNKGDIPHLTPLASLVKSPAQEVSLEEAAKKSPNVLKALQNFIKQGGEPPKGVGEYANKEFTFIRNPEKSTNMGNRFGQDIEPAGRYINLADERQTYFPPGWETGKIKFKNPLVLDWGEGYQSGNNWKNVLSQKYGGKTGKKLSKAITADGYDGIITLDNGKPSEVVSLISPPKGVGEIVDPLAKFKQKENLVKVDPILEIKKQITARDIHGNKVELPAGESLTPYELKGNKYLLKDGEEYIVNKNQYQNIKGNAVKAEAQPFAPELEQTMETVKTSAPTIISKELPSGLKVIKTKDGFGNPGYAVANEAGAQLGFATGTPELAIEQFNIKHAPIKYDNPKFSQYTLPGGKDQFEINVTVPAKPGEPTYRVPEAHSYGDESDVNRLFHIRGNRREYNGKPVTFIEEIQSDWAREARKKGMANETGLNAQGLPDLRTPYNPLLKNWQELAVKRALKDAVDNNSEYLAWTTGEQQAARYDLSKQVDEIGWYIPPTDTSVKDVYIVTNKGNEVGLTVDNTGSIINTRGEAPQSWVGKQLSDAIPKNQTDKILSTPKGKLSGEGLKIGGEWANNLYDRQLPNIVEKLTGQKPEMLDMGLPKTNDRARWEITTYGENKPLTPDTIKKGDEVYNGEYWIITDNLGKGKFKAIPRVKIYDKDKNGRYGQVVPFKDIKESAKTFFDISNPNSYQMGIKLTPEVKAKIRGEAPPVKQPSGVNPFLGLGGIGLGLYSLYQNQRQKQNILQNYIGL